MRIAFHLPNGGGAACRRGMNMSSPWRAPVWWIEDAEARHMREMEFLAQSESHSRDQAGTKLPGWLRHLLTGGAPRADERD